MKNRRGLSEKGERGASCHDAPHSKAQKQENVPLNQRLWGKPRGEGIQTEKSGAEEMVPGFALELNLAGSGGLTRDSAFSLVNHLGGQKGVGQRAACAIGT